MESDYPKASQLIKGERSQLWSVSSPPPLEPESVYRFLPGMCATCECIYVAKELGRHVYLWIA